jgi:ABC-type cobalamin/Fe3+-siderophores transport system ATPase subunit
MDVLRGLADEERALAVTSHHPNNALLYGTNVSFLIDGCCSAAAPPETAMTTSRLRAAYGMPFEIIAGDGRVRALVPDRGAGRGRGVGR